MARVWRQHSLHEPNIDQHMANIGSIYAQHGPDMIQKNGVLPLGRVHAKKEHAVLGLT